MVFRQYRIKSESALSLPEDYVREGVFFDIETTGFKASSSHVYLVGAAYFAGDEWILSQWMTEGPGEEKALLLTFAQFLRPFGRIIHFNGDRFDIPYMREKYAWHQLNDPFTALKSTDIFRDVRVLKNILSLERLNQKTLECFLGICREDRYDGGTLINVYRGYVREPSPDALHLLLLHNREDVQGMLALTGLYAYLYALGFLEDEAKLRGAGSGEADEADHGWKAVKDTMKDTMKDIVDTFFILLLFDPGNIAPKGFIIIFLERFPHYFPVASCPLQAQ